MSEESLRPTHAAHVEEETVGEVDAGPLAGDTEANDGLDDTPLGGELVGRTAIGDDFAATGALDDVASDVEVPHQLLASDERGLLDDSDEADETDTRTLHGGDTSLSDLDDGAMDDGAEGIEESFVVEDPSLLAEERDTEIDEGFEDARFAPALARETRRADRAFVVSSLPPDGDRGFLTGPPLHSPPAGCSASLVFAGLELCALYEPGATSLAVLRDGRPEIVADLGDPDDDPGPVERLRGRLRGDVVEILAEGPFGAYLLIAGPRLQGGGGS